MYKQSEITAKGFDHSIPLELENELRSPILISENIKVLHTLGDERGLAKIVDILTDKGIVRVGYYFDNAQAVLDDCQGIETVEEWATQWDVDSLLPVFCESIKAQF